MFPYSTSGGKRVLIVRIYLDNITTTKPSERAIRAALPYWEHVGTMQEHYVAIDTAVQAIYELFERPQDDRFIFTSSSAEAVSQLVASLLRDKVRQSGKNHFVVSNVSEAPAIFAISHLEDEPCFLQMAKVSSSGYLGLDALIEAVSIRTVLVSLPFACALTGVIQPLEEIAALCKKRGILLHVDATHAVGKWPLDQLQLADFVTFNGEQVHAPSGTGGLFAKHGIPIFPLIAGEEEEVRLRGGPLNVPLLVALGEASREAKESFNLYCTEVARLRALLEERVVAGYPEAEVLFQDEVRLPHVSAITFPGIHSELFAFALNRKGVFACMGGGPFQKMEHVLVASGVEKLKSQCALSFSLSKETQESEIEAASQIIVDTAKRMGRIAKGL